MRFFLDLLREIWILVLEVMAKFLIPTVAMTLIWNNIIIKYIDVILISYMDMFLILLFLRMLSVIVIKHTYTTKNVVSDENAIDNENTETEDEEDEG